MVAYFTDSCARKEDRIVEKCGINMLYTNKTFEGGPFGNNFVYKNHTSSPASCVDLLCQYNTSFGFFLDGLCYMVDCNGFCKLKESEQAKSGESAVLIELSRKGKA